MSAIHAATHRESDCTVVEVVAILDCHRDVVFAAFANAHSRSQWCAPRGAGFRYLESEFAVGARDVFECAGPAGRRLRGEVRYDDITPARRISYTETLFDGATCVASARLSVDLESPTQATTRVAFRVHLDPTVSSDMAAGYSTGLRTALEGLAAWLARTPPSDHAAPSSGESP